MNLLPEYLMVSVFLKKLVNLKKGVFYVGYFYLWDNSKKT